MKDKLLEIYERFKVRYENDIKESEIDKDIKRRTYMQFIAEYTEEVRYELFDKVESLLLDFKKKLNAWDYVFSWQVEIVCDKYGNYFIEDEDLDTQILRFIENSDTSHNFDIDIRNYDVILKEIDGDIFKEMQKGG